MLQATRRNDNREESKPDGKPRREESNADATQMDLRVAITTVPSVNLHTEQTEILRKSICNRIIEYSLSPLSENACIPQFRDDPFHLDGVLAMWCENAETLVWLKETVKTMTSPIPSTTLTVIAQSDIKKRLKARLQLNSSIDKWDQLFKLMRLQNTHYNVDAWSLYKMTINDIPKKPESDEKLVHLTLGIPEDQKKQILDRGGRVAHIAGCGYIRFYDGELGPSNKQPGEDPNKPVTAHSEQPIPLPPGRHSTTKQVPATRDQGNTSEGSDLLDTP